MFWLLLMACTGSDGEPVEVPKGEAPMKVEPSKSSLKLPEKLGSDETDVNAVFSETPSGLILLRVQPLAGSGLQLVFHTPPAPGDMVIAPSDASVKEGIAGDITKSNAKLKGTLKIQAVSEGYLKGTIDGEAVLASGASLGKVTSDFYAVPKKK